MAHSATTALPDYDPERDSGAVPSPCIGVCKLDPESGWCIGCFRDIEELRAWSTASDEAKRAIWRVLRQRIPQ